MATDYEIVRADILDAIDHISKHHSAAGAYLRDHIEMDDAAQTFRYTGDGRITLTRNPYPPFGLAFQVVDADHIRILTNEYGNPITVGRVYAVSEWRTIRRRKGVFPSIVGDDGRRITMDDRKHYETVYVDAKEADRG